MLKRSVYFSPSSSKPSQLKLPNINKKTNHKPKGYKIMTVRQSQIQNLQQNEDQSLQVTKLDQWSMNKPNKKVKTVMVNSHNMSYIYQSGTGSRIMNSRKKDKRGFTSNSGNKKDQHMDIQLYLAKIDSQLRKIKKIDYFSIYKNMDYCSGVYFNAFNDILKTLQKYYELLSSQLQLEQTLLNRQRLAHLEKIKQIGNKENHPYKDQINKVREELHQREQNLKPLKKIMGALIASKTKVLKFCLQLGYDVRQEGLIWILKELQAIPKPEEFPSFLSAKQINLILRKFANQNAKANANKRAQIKVCGKSINQAYQQVNRRKKRQLSFIKENEELKKKFSQKVKDYVPDNHRYLYNETLDIAQSIEREKSKPTKYQVIYQQTTRKLNKICKEQIHPKQKKRKRTATDKETRQKHESKEKKRRQRRNSTLIVEQFGKMLSISMDQTKQIEDLYTGEQKQLDQILRCIRQEKYETSVHKKVFEEKNQLRNPISILSCIMGWKKAEKIIQQELLNLS